MRAALLAGGLVIALIACAKQGAAQPEQTRRDTSPALLAEALVTAYPDAIARIDNGELVFTDGARLPISDGQSNKTEDAILANPDIDDMFTWTYLEGEPAPATHDPGRARHEPLFRRLYGDCRQGRDALAMRDVAWMPSLGGGALPMSTRHGAADALEAAVRELEALPPAMTRFLVPSAGSFNCRPIAGTDRLSAHGFGIAIDISTAEADYWRWAGGESARWRNRIPFEIVEIFERHGFIWGGRWRHFDTMHFEYRPELLVDRR